MTARRILVVDDNPDAADAVAVLLEIEGHEVRTAHSGRAALVEARAWTPDVMVLDIGLPDMDGYELARRVVALGITPVPLLIALSGYGGSGDIRLAREAGFSHHLLKPVEPDTDGTTSGSLHRGWVALRGSLAGYTDQAMLDECERGEDAALARYRAALREGTLPEPLRALVARQQLGVQANHDQIKRLRDSVRANG